MTDTTAPDPVAAELSAIRDRQENGDLREFATDDSPRLLRALGKALEIHHAHVSGTHPGQTRPPTFPAPGICADDRHPWPCPTYAAISAELLGSTDGT